MQYFAEQAGSADSAALEECKGSRSELPQRGAQGEWSRGEPRSGAGFGAVWMRELSSASTSETFVENRTPNPNFRRVLGGDMPPAASLRRGESSWWARMGGDSDPEGGSSVWRIIKLGKLPEGGKWRLPGVAASPVPASGD